MVSSSLRMVKALNYFRRGNRRPSLQLLEHPRNSPTSPPLKEAVSINKVGNETFILQYDLYYFLLLVLLDLDFSNNNNMILSHSHISFKFSLDSLLQQIYIQNIYIYQCNIFLCVDNTSNSPANEHAASDIREADDRAPQELLGREADDSPPQPPVNMPR